MIPTFPASKPIELADLSLIERMTQRFEPYSDFCPGVLWCWDVAGTCRISNVHGNLVVRFKDWASDDHHYGFLGDRDVLRTARTLLAHAQSEGLEPCLRLIPEAVIAADERLQSAFVITEDAAESDYVLSVPEWVALVGGKYAKHRTKIQRCRRQYSLEVRPLSLDDRPTQRAALALFDVWAAGKGESECDRELERTALERLFVTGVASRMSGCGLFDGHALRAFSIWEYAPRHRFSIHHFMKVDPQFTGASSFLIHARSSLLLQAGCAFANDEQDLGIAGLREFKRSLRPCRFLRKFVISEGPHQALAVVRQDVP